MSDKIILVETQSPANIIELYVPGPQGPGGTRANYGSFYDTTDQALAVANVAQRVNINTTLENLNVDIVEGGKITFRNPGTYSFTFSLQFTNTENNAVRAATVWLKYQGVVYPNSASYFNIPGARSGVPGELVGTVNFVASATGDDDYVEIFWTAESTSVAITSIEATGTIPMAPGVILTVTQIMNNEKGDAATIALGSVTTVAPTQPASVTNTGTSSAAVFNFSIPKGETGDVNPAMYTILASAEDARDTAIYNASLTSADIVTTASNVTQSGINKDATAADRVQTGLDRAQTGVDKLATAADRAQTGQDKLATAADRVQTGLDKAATAADRVQTGLDRAAAANSASAAEGFSNTASTTASSVSALLASFRSVFLGAFSSDSNAVAFASANGISISEGIMYENTTSDKFRIYSNNAWEDYDAEAQLSQSAAALSAANAAASESNAASSASSALTSKNAAATSEINAATSATAALASKNAAATSEINAATSATAALASKNAAATSETNAATSATAALVSKNAAATSETNAASSATSAAASAATANNANVITVATNIDGINTTATNVNSINTVATNIDTVNAVASGKISPRVVTAADGNFITPNADTTDMVVQANAQAAGTLTINAPTGTPVAGQKLVIRVACTNVQTLSWNAAYIASADLALPTATTGNSKYDYFCFIYNAMAAKWNFMAMMRGF